MATLGTLEYLISIKDNGIEAQLNKTESKVKKSGEKLSSWTIAKGQMIGRFAEKAISTVGRVAKDTVKSAVDSFAEFQQLEGGVKKLFGDHAQKVFDNASKAYIKAGVSANEYMQTVTDFSAALINSLGGNTEKAADIANQALIDMSDNANMFGSSMESIQNAYRGFSKQNYTMLDNLKLGYGGTRKEMERLLKEAEAYQKSLGNNVKYDIKNLGDVYNAINAIQQKLQITGTTEHEALETVEGSFKAAKAAWKDVLTSIGRGKDVKKSIKQFAETAKVYIGNLKPVLKESVKGVFSAVKELLPEFGSIFNDLKTELKDSDVPLLKVLGGVLETVTKISEGITNLATDFDGTVAAMKDSDDPFVKLAGGALSTAKNILSWIGDKAPWIADHVGLIASAFAGIKISGAVLKFLSLLGTSGVTSWLGKLLGNGAANAAAGAATGASATAGARWLSSVLKYGKLGAGAYAFFSTLLDTSGKTWFSGTPDTEHFGQFFESNGKLTEAGKEAGLSESDFYVKEGAAYSQWKHDKSMSNLENLLQYKKYNEDVLGFLKDIPDKSDENYVKWLGEFQQRYLNWYDNDANDPKLTAATNAIDDAMFDRLHNFMLAFGNGDGTATATEGAELFSDLQSKLQEILANSENKVPVEPDIDLSAAQQQLNGANLTVAVTPKMIGGGIFSKWFGQAKGDWAVPYDNYPSLLHRGEIVLNQSQARRYRDSESGSADASSIAAAVAGGVEKAVKKINVLMSGDKVGNLTTKRVKHNISAQSFSRQRAYGG